MLVLFLTVYFFEIQYCIQAIPVADNNPNNPFSFYVAKEQKETSTSTQPEVQLKSLPTTEYQQENIIQNKDLKKKPVPSLKPQTTTIASSREENNSSPDHNNIQTLQQTKLVIPSQTQEAPTHSTTNSPISKPVLDIFPVESNQKFTMYPEESLNPEIKETSTEPFTKTTKVVGGNEEKCESNESYDSEDRKCYRLASQGPCRFKEWWIIKEGNDKPTCEERPCPEFYARLNDNCTFIYGDKNVTGCEDGESIYHDVHGNVKCDCRPLHLHHKDACYEVYSRGPCDPEQYITYNKLSNSVECQKNPCVEGKVKWLDDCVIVGDFCGKNNDSNYLIDPNTLEVGCYEFFRAPQATGCLKGSKQQLNGQC